MEKTQIESVALELGELKFQKPGAFACCEVETGLVVYVCENDFAVGKIVESPGFRKQPGLAVTLAEARLIAKVKNKEDRNLILSERSILANVLGHRACQYKAIKVKE